MQTIIDFFNSGFVLAGVCLVLAGIFNAWLDRLDNIGAYSTSIFAKWKQDFWLKSASANRKYKRYSTGKLVVERYDHRNRAVYKPAFTFLGLRSDKSLVFLTDGWHLVQFFQWTFVCFSVVFAAGLSVGDWRFWLGWILMRILLTGAFSVFYSSILRGRV